MGDRARIVVVGPVVPAVSGGVKPLTSDVSRLYDTIAAVIHENDAVVDLPTESPQFGDVPARTFFELIERRLKSADAVVVLCAEGGVPAAVEATLASAMVKPIFLISSDGRRIHRIVEGLPTVRDVAMRNDTALAEQLRQFMMQIPRLVMA